MVLLSALVVIYSPTIYQSPNLKLISFVSGRGYLYIVPTVIHKRFALCAAGFTVVIAMCPYIPHMAVTVPRRKSVREVRKNVHLGTYKYVFVTICRCVSVPFHVYLTISLAGNITPAATDTNG